VSITVNFISALLIGELCGTVFKGQMDWSIVWYLLYIGEHVNVNPFTS
jgi:hypothetical protein